MATFSLFFVRDLCMKVEALNMAVMSRNLSAGDGIKTKSDAEFQVEKNLQIQNWHGELKVIINWWLNTSRYEKVIFFNIFS